ncbi:tail protein [Klebsiella phage YMC16/01/N133_KPN_BP]|uniref:Putative virion structural protein n=1 Tax=Klebsiella phage YMC16/01/N133_KPN_BP TaxID=2026102 RepID=A0A248XD75_9CAUD|nr:tail protein [Klebsiella phage YMC16/01/N133_KPN_BP]ASW27651.1 putative virion structural protein [Klebsiella phage YMC16/01/N133_KPN_BP]
MGSSKKKSTVGYKYYTTLHFAICHGPVNSIRSIWWSDKVAWQDSWVQGPGDPVMWNFKNESMFGGDDSEGGASGRVEFGFGTADQTMHGVLPNGTYDPAQMTKAALGVDSPAFPSMAINYRGLCVLFMHDNYIGNNAYLKDLSVEVERYWTGWQPGLARIGDNMNPAHIIYECLTNEEWGLGYDSSVIDDEAFTASAQTLYNEGFGLSFVWDSDQDIYDFVDQVRSCIEAAFYLNRRTGKYTLKLIRAGATPKLTVSPSNATLESFSRKAMGETSNEISVTWRNPNNEEDETVTVQDVANIEAQGRVIQTAKEYIGVRSAALATTLAQRDLQTISAQLSAAEVVVNRQAWDLMPGDVVTLNWPPLGISDLQMRVTEAAQSEPGSDSIRLQLGEDIFGRASGSFSGVQDPGWVDPASPPTLFPFTLPWEYPYPYVVNYMELDPSTLPEDTAYGTDLAAGGASSSRRLRLYGRVTTENGPAWEVLDTGAVTTVSKLASALTRELTSTAALDGTQSFDLAAVDTDSFVVLSDGTHQEIAQVSGDPASGTITLTRGLMDTHPRQWPAGTMLWFVGTTGFVSDVTQWSRGSVGRYKPSMQTPQGFFDPDSIPEDTITFRSRFSLPYSVANVTVEGSYWPATVTMAQGDFLFSVDWSTRNRLLQDSPVQVPWGAGSISPEEGTTFVAELWQGSTLVATSGEVTGTHADIPLYGVASGTYTLRVYSLRGGYRNYIDYEHTFNLVAPAANTGYGNGYGFGYGV